MSINLSQIISPKSKIQTFLDRYQYFISIVATFLFFTEIPDYLFTINFLPLNPLAWIGTFAFLSLPFIKKITSMPKPLVIGLIFYTAIAIFSLMTVSSDEESMQDFRLRILSVLFICLMYVIYEQKSLTQVKYALMAAVFLSVFNNFFELANPGIFSDLNVGRPAGFYINPTKTGAALVIGMLFGINVIKKQYRWLFVLIIGLGVVCTFSRGPILGWLICLPLLIGARVLSDKRRTVVMPILILVAVVSVTNPLALLTNYFSGGTDGSYWNVLNRLEQFQAPSLEDDSSKERKLVAREAWYMFGKHPFWGNGLGSTHKWTVADVSTHNMYLYDMADNGIIGLLFLPGAIFAVVYRNQGEQKVILICYAIFMSLLGVFSHNVLEERYILISFSLLAAMNSNQQRYSSYAPGNFRMALPPAKAQFLLPPARSQRMLPPAAYQKTSPPRNK